MLCLFYVLTFFTLTPCFTDYQGFNPMIQPPQGRLSMQDQAQLNWDDPTFYNLMLLRAQRQQFPAAMPTRPSAMMSDAGFDPSLNLAQNPASFSRFASSAAAQQQGGFMDHLRYLNQQQYTGDLLGQRGAGGLPPPATYQSMPAGFPSQDVLSAAGTQQNLGQGWSTYPRSEASLGMLPSTWPPLGFPPNAGSSIPDTTARETSSARGTKKSKVARRRARKEERKTTTETEGKEESIERQEATGRSTTLYMPSDDHTLSEYQCLARKQIELFAAQQIDVQSSAQGRNKPIVLDQVGIRCRHCADLPPKSRARGAVYYPSTLKGLYQAAQNMASSHLCVHCEEVPEQLRQELLLLRERKSSAGGGKDYWASAARALGAVEDENNSILRFRG